MALAALILINRDMIYEFNCEHCNGNFEANLPMADCQKPLSEPCPLCGKSGKIYRVYEPASFATNLINTKEKLAGQGWKDTMARIDANHRGITNLGGKGHY